MISHSVEFCPDEVDTLRKRLDELAKEGVRIVSVLWQPQSPQPETDQAAAISSRGTYVIIVENDSEPSLQARQESDENKEILADVAALG